MSILCLDFINSQWYNSHKPFEEPLKSAIWRDEFCQKWGLPNVEESEEIISELETLRGFLHEVAIEYVSGREISEVNLKKLNHHLKLAHAPRQLKKDGQKLLWSIKPSDNTLDWMMAQIVLSFAAMLTEYPVDRVKLCGNPDCGWIFYDESKSKTKKWCENTCASLIKVRKFRANQK